MSDRKLLITGASGYLGRHVVEALRSGEKIEIHLAGRKQQPHFGNFLFHSVDLLELEKGKRLVEEIRPTDLLCLAWCANPKTFWTDPLNETWRDATRELIETFHKVGGRHVVVAGSCAEYDWTAGSLFSEETTPARPATLYGRCKNELRLWLEQFGAAHGLGWSWGRIFWTYGPGEPPEKLVAYVIQKLLRNEPALLGHCRAIRDFLDAPDIGRALAFLSANRCGGIYNIGSGEGIKLRDLVMKIGVALGKTDLIQFADPPAPVDEAPEIVADVRRLRQAGWQPAYSLDEALQTTIDWNRRLINSPAA
ncbi:MAG: NAD(P)-dependent oxidoreductase [bacterium]